MRILKRLLLGLLLLVLLIGSGVGALLWSTLPGGDRTAAIPGLTAPVDITIDADGVPRVQAQNTLDAAAALGFLHARERMFQMDLMRRAAAGELSELLGTSTLPVDRLMRMLGVRARAEADLATLAPDTRAALEAYASGVNAWIAARGRLAALEFLAIGPPRPWAAVDTLLWGKTMGLYLSGNWRGELARAALQRQSPPDILRQLSPAAGGAGHPEASLATTAAALLAALPTFPDRFTLPASASDEWAVDARHSATGAPLLAGDPHLAFGAPGFWYLARIETPDGVLAGATAPGVPFLVLGHNGKIAWTFTTTGADVQDLFEETPVEGGYQTPDGPRRFTTRSETIHIRGAADELLTVRETRHGPVISDLVAPQGPILAVAMANLAPGDTAATGLQALNRATDVASAGRAAAQLSSPVQNLLVADAHDIGLFVGGRVPVRRAGDGRAPVPGQDGAHDWIGWASGAELPHVVSPPSGRLVNGNERVAPPDFPVFLGADWPGDWRARRIRALLDATPQHTVAEFAAMQVDTVSAFAQALLPRLRLVAPADTASQAALRLLDGWNGAMDADAPQPLIFNAWMQRLHASLLARLGVPPSAATPGMELVEAALSDPARCGGDCGPMLADGLQATMADLAKSNGPDPARWHWGDAHQAVFAHPVLGRIPLLDRLTTARIAVPGDDATLFRGGMFPGSFTALHGAAFRGVYDLADLERSRFVVAPGQSGNPLSRLAWNFVQRWHDGGSISLVATPESVMAKIRLLPDQERR